MTEQRERRHFSMIRNFHLADFFTIANGACGITAIFHAMKYLLTKDSLQIYVACALVPLAIVFDFLDGRVARWRHEASPLGREMDSLADVVSFGIAPATIAYSMGLNTLLDQIVLVYFAVCGLSRLARYNVTAESLSDSKGKVQYFEGTPITFSLIPLGILLFLFTRGLSAPWTFGTLPFHPVSLIFFVSGCFMISKTLHIPKP